MTGKSKPFEIIEEFGELSRTESGWVKMVTTVSWYGKEPKLDIRTWKPDRTRPAKGGITLTIAEARALKRVLNKMDI